MSGAASRCSCSCALASSHFCASLATSRSFCRVHRSHIALVYGAIAFRVPELTPKKIINHEPYTAVVAMPWSLVVYSHRTCRSSPCTACTCASAAACAVRLAASSTCALLSSDARSASRALDPCGDVHRCMCLTCIHDKLLPCITIRC